MWETFVFSRMETPSRRSSFSSARVTSLAFSLTGNTRSPRSTFTGQPSRSSRAIMSSGPKAFSALNRNRGFLTTLFRKAAGSQALVTLQRPLPVM